MANKKVSQLVSKPSVLVTDLFPIADPTTGQLFKTTISDLGTAIGSGVSSVNTLVGAVVLDTDDIQELASPTNRWFTDTRARAAISGGTGISYNSGTGVITNAVTSGQIATALGYTPADGANYLPLAGGTMGGAIFGTIATFASSSSVIALGINLSGASGDGVKITHSAGRAFNIQSSGSGFGILINNETASTSAPFTIQKQGLAVITLTDAGAGSFASSLTANSFIKTSGTSSQFLKADGSVDSSTYLTTGTAASTYVALTGNQTIAGQKTFSSSLFGTSGVFSGLLSGTTLSINGDNSTNAVSIVHNSSFNTFVVTQSGAGSAIYATGKLTVIGTAYISGQVQFGSSTFLTNLTQTITLPTSSGTLALTSDLSAYLPLSGGTLTGALSGTTLALSGGTGGLNFTSSTTITNTASSGFTAIYANGGGIYLGGSASTNHFSILSSGNVGINTTSPTQRLEVVSNNVRVAATDTANGTAGFYMRVQSGGSTVSNATIRTDNTGLFSIFTGTTGETQALNITSGGNVCIARTSSLLSSVFSIDQFGSGSTNIALNHFYSGNKYIDFGWYSSSIGSITNTSGVAVSYNTTSDYRLKEDLKSINGLEIVSKINVYDYKWKSVNLRMGGVLAHELQEILPYAVTGVKDGEQMQSVDYSKIVPVMVQAIKEEDAKIIALQNKVSQLETEIQKLKNK